MENKQFPNKLKKFRRIAGYSQKKVARALGFADTSVISRWEHGAVLPGMNHVFKLSKLYNTLPHVLFEALWNHLDTDASLFITTNTSPEEFYL